MTETISTFFQDDHREIDAILEKVAFGSSPEALEAFREFHKPLDAVRLGLAPTLVGLTALVEVVDHDFTAWAGGRLSAAETGEWRS